MTAATTPTAASTAEQMEAARTAALAEGKSLGTSEGAAAERARVAAILSHAEAAGRSELASHLALKTDLSVEKAAEMLAAAPKKEAAGGKSPLELAMERNGTPALVNDPAAAALEPALHAGKNVDAFWAPAIARASARVTKGK